MTRRSRVISTPPVDLNDGLTAAGLDAHAAEQLAALPYQTFNVDPRRPFRAPGAASAECFYVRSGLLAKFRVEVGGRRQIVGLCFPGEGIVSPNKDASCGVQAIVASEVLIFKREDVDGAIENCPKIASFFLMRSHKEAAICQEWLVNCGSRDMTARVAHLLCETAMRMGIDAREHAISNPFTQQQIAEITGQTSVNVNRVLADLERSGIIARSGSEIGVLDWSELTRVGGFKPSYLH